jgi:hypothetical protein
MTQISSVDYTTLRIFLHVDTTTAGFDPAAMQKEYRTLRRTVEANRKFDPMVSFSGNESKGGGNFTPSLTKLRTGVRIVPWDTPHTLDIQNEIVNLDDSLSDIDVFDRSGVTSNVDIDVTYSPVEIREVTTGGGGSVTADDVLIQSIIANQINGR